MASVETPCRLEERQPHRVRRLRPGRQLRLEQRRQKKRVAGQFHGAGFAQASPRAHAQTGRLKLRLKLFVDAVIAVILLGMIGGSANGVKLRAGQDLDRVVAGALGTARAPVRQGAR